ASPPISVPDLDRASNTVHVATIIDAILKVAAGAATAGTYDLMNKPQWSWKEVFEYEGRQVGMSPTFTGWSEIANDGFVGLAYRNATRYMMTAAANPLIRKTGSRIAALFPTEWHRRLKARYSMKAAAAEIAKLFPKREPMEAVLRKPVGWKFLDSLTPTA